jgi:uncharacterized damage-inducible protein DinB
MLTIDCPQRGDSKRRTGRCNVSDVKPANPELPRPSLAEPWLRGTIREFSAVPRAVLHALELAQEDLEKWCAPLTDQQLNARPAGLPPVAFHLRHIARSLDRLLTYAEGRALTNQQLARLESELEPSATRDSVFTELVAALRGSAERIRILASADLEQSRTVGQRALPTTVGGLLVHVAEHTQRHVGQALTTAKVIAAQRS